MFGPLGTSTTRIISEEDIIPNRAAGYRVVKGQLKNQEWVSPTLNTTADGSLYFSILIWKRWTRRSRKAGVAEEIKLRRDVDYSEVKDGKPNSGDYGFGWFRRIFTVIRSSSNEGAWQDSTRASTAM